MYDKYLSSQMDGDNYVPIATLATFNMIKRYNPSIKLICEAVEESPLLQLDLNNSKIRAACKRCIIILREIADESAGQVSFSLFSFLIFSNKIHNFVLNRKF